MIKAKEVSLQNLAFYLTLSLVAAAGVVAFRPHQIVSQSAPVFYGEEVTVQTAAKPTVLVKAQSAAKTISTPAPVSPALPLPIVPPAVTFKVLPAYPASALEQGVEGTVLLSVYVGLSGKAEQVETKLSSGVKELDAAAINAVSQWTFSPASQAGTALASWFEVPVRFELK